MAAAAPARSSAEDNGGRTAVAAAAASASQEVASAASHAPALVEHWHLPSILTTPYVHRYYRGAHGYRACVRSVFALHNQTFNVWTHLLGLCYFVGAAWEAGARLAARGAGRGEALVTALFYAGAIFQMGASAAYHTFGSGAGDARAGRRGGEARHAAFLKADLLGIIVMIAGSYQLGLFHGFVCAPGKSLAYTAAVATLLALAAALSLLDDVCAPAAQQHARTAACAAAVLFGIVPVIEWYVTEGVTLPADIQALWLRSAVAMFGFYGGGLLFFVSRLPERLAPGLFDLVGASHQIWHVCVWAAGAAWAHGMLRLADFRAEQAAAGVLCASA